MTRYSKEFKENIIKQMMPPTNKSVNQLAAETSVSEHTLYAWKRAAKSAGIAAPAGESSSERWSSEDKFLIVLETASMNQAELAAYCREKGLYVEQVEAWKDFCINANGGVAEQSKSLQKNLKEKEKEVKQLSKELRRKEAALAETAALLVLRKKAQAAWGDHEED